MAEPRTPYPGYDVLAKRETPSWDETTRRVVDERLGIAPDRPRFFSDDEFRTLRALCDRIVPQPADRDPPVPVAALVDAMMAGGHEDGYRHAALPPRGEAWRRILAALDEEARAQHGGPFAAVSPERQDTLLRAMQEGRLASPALAGAPSDLVFKARILHDVPRVYYAHPAAWSEIGWGGPASPRGYVRLGFDQRDAWEAAEARPGREAEAGRTNRHVGRY